MSLECDAREFKKGCIRVDVTLLPPPPGLSVIVLVLPLPASVDLTPPLWKIGLVCWLLRRRAGLDRERRGPSRESDVWQAGSNICNIPIYFTVHAAAYMKVLEQTPHFVKAPSDIFDK